MNGGTNGHAGWLQTISVGLGIAAILGAALLFLGDSRYLRQAQARRTVAEVVQAEGQTRAAAESEAAENRRDHTAIQRELADRLGRIETSQQTMLEALRRLEDRQDRAAATQRAPARRTVRQ